MTTLAQKRRAYGRLLVICEVYGDERHLAALERARHKTIETHSRPAFVARRGPGEREGNLSRSKMDKAIEEN